MIFPSRDTNFFLPMNRMVQSEFIQCSRVGSKDLNLFIFGGFYIVLSTVQVISRRVVGSVEETSTYSWSGFCTVNCNIIRI